jgi:fatty-acyl-CoA synthase
VIEAYRQRQLSESYWEADHSRPYRTWTLGQALAHAADTVPERAALIEYLPDGQRGRIWTYGALQAEARRVAAALLTRFKPGDRVAVCANNIPEWVLLLYGTALAGIVLVTVNPACKARELRHILGNSGAVGLFTIDSFRGADCLAGIEALRGDLPDLREIIRLAEFEAFVEAGEGACAVLPAVASRDPCLILFTSGTTGLQKGVVYHHEGVANMALLTHERGGLQDGGVFVSPMPLFYIGGLGHVGVGAVMHLATHVVVPHFDPELFMSIAERERGTYSLLVPTMIEAILAHPARPKYDLRSLTNLISGASVVEAQLIRRTNRELSCTLCNVYGQTEMQGVVTSTHRDDADEDVTGTIGQPLCHFDVKIADPETGAVRPLGEPGEIWVRGPQVMLGYFGMAEETARTLQPDGWLRSGDLATMDARGFVTITGRMKEMIIRGGENVYPREVENVLLEHDAIDAVAVVGVPHPYWGEQVAAVIVPKDPQSPPEAEALQAFARGNLAAFKTPTQWYFVDAFSFTDTGKIQKYKLLEAIAAGTLVPAASRMAEAGGSQPAR